MAQTSSINAKTRTLIRYCKSIVHDKSKGIARKNRSGLCYESAPLRIILQCFPILFCGEGKRRKATFRRQDQQSDAAVK